MDKQLPVISRRDRGWSFAVFENKAEDGKLHYHISLQRSYKNKSGAVVQETIHCFQDDLLPLAELARLGYCDLGEYRYKKWKESKNNGSEQQTEQQAEPPVEDNIPF